MVAEAEGDRRLRATIVNVRVRITRLQVSRSDANARDNHVVMDRPNPLTLRLLGITARNSSNNHQQTQPPKPAQLLIEKKQREQRTNQRLDTRGGVAPAGPCTVPKTVAVDYTANYVFWAKK